MYTIARYGIWCSADLCHVFLGASRQIWLFLRVSYNFTFEKHRRPERSERNSDEQKRHSQQWAMKYLFILSKMWKSVPLAGGKIYRCVWLICVHAKCISAVYQLWYAVVLYHLCVIEVLYGGVLWCMNCICVYVCAYYLLIYSCA